MKGIITVIGRDQIGIISKVCTWLSDKNINILDISQSIVHGYFNMFMIIDFADSTIKFEDATTELDKLGENIGLKVRLQHEDIFNSMHRI